MAARGQGVANLLDDIANTELKLSDEQRDILHNHARNHVDFSNLGVTRKYNEQRIQNDSMIDPYYGMPRAYEIPLLDDAKIPTGPLSNNPEQVLTELGAAVSQMERQAYVRAHEFELWQKYYAREKQHMLEEAKEQGINIDGSSRFRPLG